MLLGQVYRAVVAEGLPGAGNQVAVKVRMDLQANQGKRVVTGPGVAQGDGLSEPAITASLSLPIWVKFVEFAFDFDLHPGSTFISGAHCNFFVQVQRPGVVELISMDVYILRYIAAVLRQVGRLNSDLAALVDEWATSLFKWV